MVQTPLAEHRPLVAPTPQDASRSLQELGFLVRSDLPDRAGPAYLLVALRDHPALTHYDPELVEYWVSRDGVGRREHLTRQSALPIDDRPFSWGEIQIIDRLHVTNEYLTFGGRLSAALVDDVVIAVFTSTVPLLRRGGHSQAWDEAAENVGAFFGRAKVAVDYVPGFEAHFAALRPEACYGAFIADLADRYRAQPRLREAEPHLWSLVSTEEHRLERSFPADLRDGRRLLERMRT
ncbi:MAG TPA: hypothetical protein VK194_06290, partial [Candidatus Deferrimicrobium sp.]|nr:hypothetical protein [Candidatus Deferrimicrobium sp.]